VKFYVSALVGVIKDRCCFAHCVWCVYVGSHSCADQDLFFVLTKSLSSSCFTALVIIVESLINRRGTIANSHVG